MANNINELIIKESIKRERKYNAIKLPENLNQHMLPKYVGYYKECYNIQKKLYREFFKIEKHPKIQGKKIYTSSKSNKINILEKLQQIKSILENIENDGLNQFNECKEVNETKEVNDDQKNNKIIMPKYISLKQNLTDNNKYYLMYDKKTNNMRYTLKTLYTKDVLLKDNLSNFLQKLDEKFNKNNDEILLE